MTSELAAGVEGFCFFLLLFAVTNDGDFKEVQFLVLHTIFIALIRGKVVRFDF